MRKNFIILSILILLILPVLIYFDILFVLLAMVLMPVIILGFVDIFQKKKAILRNFPILGHFRYLMELIRPEISQYFVETDLGGRPFNRVIRSVIYQRSKKELDKEPFGTKLDFYENGYEWLVHSMMPKPIIENDLRVTFGGPDCLQPYSASILNVSAMSFGALSKNAIMALNGGAKMGNFAHNTGEGGLSPYHLEMGGDLIWQIGTGYFSCRDENGNFSETLFAEKSATPNVKMIEIKLSQGAKPGHGGILPGEKNNEEIARIRGVKPHVDIISPSYHKAFSNPNEFVLFIKKLRDLSKGKPVGFKLCIGQKNEFTEICRTMAETKIYPDFITIDGAEGGTGAAPLEFSNWVGMPLTEGLTFAYDTLVGFDIKKHIKIIAAGKVATGFDIIRLLALGADTCNSARAMMMSIGCIQALRCHSNHCPTGVATQDPDLIKGLVVEEKIERSYNFHKETIHSVKELLACAGLDSLEKLHRSLIYRRMDSASIKNFEELYPYCEVNYLINEVTAGQTGSKINNLDGIYKSYEKDVLDLK
jgi:glutamate synthase domain-containing protein 2